MKAARFFFLTLLLMHTTSFAKVLLSIEGLSGAGKSTLAKALTKYMSEACFIEEPFDRWNDVSKQGNLFELFLKDRSRWGLTFQNYIFLTHLQAVENAYRENPAAPVFISDRSPYSGMNIFTKMLFDQGLLSNIEWAIYQKSSTWFLEQLPGYVPDGFIYLRTLAKTACSRANKRNRRLNASLQLEYFQTLYKYHEEWLITKKNVSVTSAPEAPVLVIDGEVDFEQSTEIQQEIVSKIRAFIASLETVKKSMF